MGSIMVDGNTFYTIDDIASKNCLFNFCNTPRESGKTFSTKKKMVQDFLDGKGRFVYIRRRDIELKSVTKKTFFEKLQTKGLFVDYSFNYKDGAFTISGEKYDNEIIGYSTSLSTQKNFRSMEFTDISAIYFEEYIVDPNSNTAYLKNEVKEFLELYSTISRGEDIPVFFMGNNLTGYNPYILYFNLIPPKNGIKVWNDIAIEEWNDTSYGDRKSFTRFGKLVRDTPYGQYAYFNKPLFNKEEKRFSLPSNAKPICQIRWENNVFSCWNNSGGLYITEKPVKKLQITNCEPAKNEINIIHPRAQLCKNIIKNYLSTGRVYYTSEKAEELSRDFIRYMI